MAIRNTISSNIFLIKNLRALNGNRTILSNVKVYNSLYVTMVQERKISKCAITPNIKLNTLSPVDKTPKLIATGFRPLVVIFEYLNAKDKHIRKYVDLYTDFGFDVLQVHLKPWQVLWPKSGSQVVAKDVAQFLLTNEGRFSPMVIHGFSVGAYLWGEVLVYFSKNLSEFQVVTDRIKCKIFDSAVDVNEIQKGFPHALFPKNTILRSACEKYIRYHLKAFYEESTVHYHASRREFSSDIIKCPTLMITSKSDPLSSILVNETVRQEISAANLECFLKVFEDSNHVAHFMKYREEYIAEIESFLTKVNILPVQKLKAKL